MKFEELDAAKLDWAFLFEAPVRNLDVHNFRYLVARVGSQVKFVAQVSGITVSPAVPKQSEALWKVHFDRVREVADIDMDLGLHSDRIVVINPKHEELLKDAVLDSAALERPEKLPVYLTIKEAEEALHVRYGVPKSNIKISLHN
ncbi:hypothetical protein [Pseudomonas soli]|uniref:Uncharacterized protein n=1 Tax=Pseudomonas soli TaxID=1306993 RepID=A0AAJ5MHZ4_9PSED|nr:hypothetical protein [Pseudomonas soli]UXZ43617.1 hypothetical protein K7K07_16195 [Pseudomonas soli]